MTAEEARQQYAMQGYVLIRDALAPEELERVRAAFHRAAEKKALREILDQDEVFLDMVDHPVLLGVVRAVVGEDAQLRYAQGGIVPAEAGAGSGWHCDLSGLLGVYMPESIVMTKLFTYLEDVPENGACLSLVPGSHRYPMGHPLPDIAAHEEMPHHVKMVVRAGDAVLMNGYTWHARFPNLSDRPRKVLEYSYTHAWMKTFYQFRDFTPRVQELILQSHNRRQLFGLPEPGRSDWERRLEGSEPYRPVEVGV